MGGVCCSRSRLEAAGCGDLSLMSSGCLLEQRQIWTAAGLSPEAEKQWLGWGLGVVQTIFWPLGKETKTLPTLLPTVSAWGSQNQEPARACHRVR